MAIFYTSYPNTQPSTSLTQYVVGDWWVNLSLRYAYKLSLNGAGFKSWVRTTTAPLPNIIAIPTIVASTTTNSTTATIGQSVSFDAVTAYGGATAATSYTSTGTVTGYNVTVSPALPSGLSVTKVLSVITGTDSNGNAALYNNIVVRITGTPTGTATLPTSYTVTLTDASGLSGSASFTLAVQSSGVTALTTTLAVPSSTFTQGNTVSVTPVTAAGGTTPLTFSISPSLSGSGLTLNSSNGAITGTANTILSTNYTITVTDSSSVPQSNSRSYSLTVNGIPLNSFVDTPTTVLTNKIAFTSFRPVRATGGFGTLTYAITPALPAGLTYNTSTGFITGTATESSPQTQYSVTVSDSSTPKQTTTPLTFNLTVNELQPVTAIVAQGTLSLTINTPVSTAPVQGGATIPIQGGGGFGTLSYSLSPALGVAGLTFDTTTGIISGTPTATKALTTYTVTVTDQATTPQTANAQFSLSVAAATLATSLDISPLSLFKGVPITLTSAVGYKPVSATDGTGTYSYALTGNTLPTGLSFSNSTGIITGTANTLMVSPGNTFTVTVTDQTTPVNQTSSKNFVLIVSNPPALVLTNNETGTRTLTRGISTSFTPATASGGYGTYTYSISPSLPASLVLNTNNGTISGTAANSNTSITTYTVSVTDQASQTQNTTFDLVINTPAYIKLSTTPTQNVTRDVPVISFAPLLVTGGDPGYTYSVSTGTLPAGLSLNSSTGYLSGTPTIVAANTFTITATDQASQNLTQNCTVTVAAPAALTTTLNQTNTRTLVVNSTQTAFTPVTASGGYGTISFAIAPTLPSGLTFLSANGYIFGTASALRTNSSYRVTVSDTVSPPQTSFKDFFLEVVNAPLIATKNIADRSIVKNTIITSFTPIIASGGTPPYTYSATLPSGLTINTTTGVITGNTSVTQSSTATTVNVSDVAGASTSNTFNLTITEPAALTANTSAANATFGVAYNRQIVVPSGGFGNYTYAFTNGTLTGTGLALNANTGFIAGTPTALKANSSYTIQVSDTSGQTANGTFNFSILPPALTVTVSSNSVTIQQYRSVTPFIPVKGNGGFGTLTYQITSGSLPAGLSFNTSTGQITGTPSATAAVSLTITITDEALTPQTVNGTFTLNVSASAPAALQAILGQSSYSFTVGENVNFTPVTGSGGYPGNSYQYTLTGTLPAGLSFNTSTGNISGIFTEAFTSTSFTVTVNDEVPQYASKSFALEATVALVSAVDLLARNRSQSSFDHANAAFIKANSAYGSQNTTGTYANSAYAQANAAFLVANTPNHTSNSASLYANAAFIQANGAFLASNTPSHVANSGSSYANAAFIQANAAFAYANTLGSGNLDQFARDAANSAGSYANSAFIKANSAYESQNTTGTYANNAYAQANTATNNAAGASLYANAAFIQANAAYNLANSISSGSIDSYARDTANSASLYANGAFSQANTANTNAATADSKAVTAGSYANSAYTQANTATNNAAGASLYANGAFAQANAAFDKANTGVANTATTANVAINARITIVNTGIYYPIVTDTTITGSDTFHYSSSDFLMYAANNTFRAAGNVWAGENIVVGNNVPVVNSTGHWVGQPLVANNASTANVSNVAINARITIVNTGIYYPIVTDTTITGTDTLHYSSNDFVMFAANNTFRATGNIWAVQNIAVGTNIPVVNSTGHWVGQALSATDSFARNTANASFIQANAAFNRVNTGAASFISSGTSNVFFAAANGNIVANVNGNTIFTVSETNILFTNEDINGANNIYATSFIANSAIRVAGTGGSLSGANNIFANNIVANVGMTIAGTNVLPYIQSSFDRANTDVTNITISSPGTYGNATYIPVITVSANGRINTISTIEAAGGGGGSGTDQFARDRANAAFIQANAAFNTANAGGGGGGGSTTVDHFTGDGNTTSFTLSTTPSSIDNIIVNIEGVFQLQNAYSLNTNNLIFTSAPANTSSIDVYKLGGGTDPATSNTANAAFIQANTAANNAAGASLYANGAFIQANAAYNQANTDFTNITIASPGTYGNATFVPVITVEANGRINTISTIAITGGGGGSDPAAGNTANAAYAHANAAFNAANTVTSNNGATLSGTIVPLANTSDQFNIIGVTGNITIAAPAEPYVEGQKLIIRIKDAGTSVNISWNVIYRSIGTNLPTTTNPNKTAYIGFIYNTADADWDAVAISLEA